MKHANFRTICLSLLLMAAAMTLTACGGKSIDLTDYIETDINGLNGHAAVVCDLDYDALYAAVTSQQGSSSDSFLQQVVVLEEAFSHITVTATPSENLSNGDTVTITAVYDAPKDIDVGCKLKSGKTTFKVEGLADGQLFDFFDEDAVKVTFAGMSGSGTATVSVTSDEDAYRRTQYTLSAAEGLSNGDEVILTAKAWDSMLENNGYYAEETEKTYTVSGLAEPFTALDKLSAADRTKTETLALEKAKQEAEDWYSYMELSSISCADIYCYTGHVKDVWNGLDSNGGLVVLVSCDFGADGEYTMAVFFQSCGKGDSGAVIFDEKDIVTVSDDVSAANALAWLQDTFADVTFTRMG